MAQLSGRAKEKLDEVKSRKAARPKTSKPKTLKLGEIVQLYKDAFTKVGKKHMSFSKNKVNWYARALKGFFNNDRQQLEEYLDYCLANWENLIKCQFKSGLSGYGPPIAFISTHSVIETILDYKEGRREYIDRNATRQANRGKYEGTLAQELNTMEEVEIYKTAIAEGHEIKTREDFDNYCKEKGL